MRRSHHLSEDIQPGNNRRRGSQQPGHAASRSSLRLTRTESACSCRVRTPGTGAPRRAAPGCRTPDAELAVRPCPRPVLYRSARRRTRARNPRCRRTRARSAQP